MSRSIDSLSNRPEEKSTRPVAGDVVRPHSKSSPQAGEIVQPRGGKAVPKAAPAESRTLAAELDAEKAHSQLKRANSIGWKFAQLSLKKKLVFISSLLILGVLIYVGVRYFQNKDAIARINGKTISKQEYDKAKEAYRKLALTRDGKNGNSDTDAYAREQLIIEKALLAEAERNKIIFNDADIAKELLKNPDSKKGSNDSETVSLNIARIKGLYGIEDDATAIRAIRIEALKNALSSKVLSYRDILHVIARWDISAVNGRTWNADEADRIAKGALEQRIQPLFDRNATDDEIMRVATNGRDLEDANSLSPSAIIPIKMFGLNRAADPGRFQDQSEWGEIEKLQKVGDYTPVTRSAAGYYYIDRLIGIGTGNYKSWDDYVQSVLQSADLYKDGWDARRLTSVFVPRAQASSDTFMCSVSSDAQSTLGAILRTVFGIKEASACSVTATDRHTVTFRGKAMKSSGDPWVGATVLVTPRSGEARCGTSSSDGTFTTDGAGNWITGGWSGNALNDADAVLIGQSFSCYMKWKAIVTVPGGCTKEVNLTMPVGANGTNQSDKNIYIDCANNSNGTLRVTHVLHDRFGNIAEGRVPTTAKLITCPANYSVANSGNPFGIIGFVCLDNDAVSSVEFRGLIPPRNDYYLAFVGGLGVLDPNWSLLKIEARYSSSLGSVVDITAGNHDFKVEPNQTSDIQVHFKDARNEPPKIKFTGRKTNRIGYTGSAPYDNARVCIDATACDTSNPYAINEISANQDHVLKPDAVSGFEIEGYKENGGNLVPSQEYNYYSGAASDGDTITVDWIYKPRVTATITPDCSIISVATSAPSGVTYNLIFDGTSLGNITSYNVPDDKKDGVARTVSIKANYLGAEYDLDTKTHQCPNNATCSADFSAAFNGLAGSIGQTITIPVTMRNTGLSIWANRSGGATQKVVLTSDAIPYWDVATSTTELGAGETVLPNGDKLFNISVTSKPAALTPATPLGFIMNASGGLNSNGDFGLACRTVIRMQSGYAPWLRTQNGGAVALGAMTGQTDLSRGMRKSSGARQDINKEAQFVILASLGGNRFCTSNAYDLGHGASANASCTFQGYVTNGYNLGDVNDVLNDSIYNSARKVLADASCSVSASKYNYANPASTGNMADTNTALDWPANFPGDCPTIYGFTGNRIGPASGSTTVRYKGGRSTLVVDGSLTITANIINQYEPTYSINPSDDLPKSLNKLPNLGIIVKGDVIVGPDVTRLDATIYATGKILTCSSYPGTTGVQTSVVAKACRNKLTVRGGLFAKGGFNFGRNFYDVAGIAARLSIAGGANAFTNPDFDYKPGDSDNPLPQGKYFGGAAEDVVGTGLNSILPPLGMTDINDQSFVGVQYLGGSFAPRF